MCIIVLSCHIIQNTYYSYVAQELLVDRRIYGRKRANDEIFIPNTGHFLILELGDYDYRGITANNWPRSRGNTAVVNSIPAVLPSTLSPLPWDYRGYRGIPVVPITVQLTSVY